MWEGHLENKLQDMKFIPRDGVCGGSAGATESYSAFVVLSMFYGRCLSFPFCLVSWGAISLSSQAEFGAHFLCSHDKLCKSPLIYVTQLIKFSMFLTSHFNVRSVRPYLVLLFLFIGDPSHTVPGPKRVLCACLMNPARGHVPILKKTSTHAKNKINLPSSAFLMFFS